MQNFIRAENGKFILDKKEIMLRGFNIGSWMNIENFMIRIPGTEKGIRQIFTEVYGKKNAEKFFDDYLNYFITEKDFILLKNLGVNVLRLPFSYRHFEDDRAPGILKPEGFTQLDRVLELCKKYKIFAILDMHSSPGGQNPESHGGGDTGVSEFWSDASLRTRMINLWGYIAQRYKDESIIAGFDILNEPYLVTDVEGFNKFYDEVIRKIRGVDTNHIVFLEGDDWAKDFSIFKSLGGYQQAISFHFYPGQHVYLSTERLARAEELEHKLKYFTDLREKTGMPLWVGETGGHFPQSKLTEGMELVKDCLDIFEKHHISWTIWSYKDAHAMGMVYPKENTKWMAMANELRRIWQVKERGNPAIADEVFLMLENKFSQPIDSSLKEQLRFRVYALVNEFLIHQILKPKLQATPWEEIKEYPKSFLLENCDGLQELAEIVKTYTNC
jgi:aryl-phospho-beta-D-glucosidase BglC (GH1 family)